MKRVILSTLSLLCFLTISFSSYPTYETDPVYTLVWSDEFDTDGAPDASKWHHQTMFPVGTSWFNGELQHYTDELTNSFIESGVLKIVAKKESYTDQSVTKEYTSARLNSKFAFTYGKVEIRAKLPAGAGTWPAFWTLGKNIDENGGFWDATDGAVAWPACGEIDIMEHWGSNQNVVQSAMHTPSSSGGTINKGDQTIATASSEFHVYGMEWTEDKIIFDVDGVVHYTYEPAVKDASTWPFDADQYLLLNTAIESNMATVNPTFTEATMEIDYVRVYEATPAVAGTEVIDLTFDDVASASSWTEVADATSADASISWGDGLGETGGALQLTASNSSEVGKAYIFQYDGTGLNYDGATDVQLTFDLKTAGALNGAAVHLQTNIPGAGVENNFDLQTQGLNDATWTNYSFDFTSVDAAASTFSIHFNMASGAFIGAGGTLLVDNIKLTTSGGGGGGGGGPVAPTVAADAPTENAADVASIYSDSYTDVPNLGYNLYGGAAYEAVDLSGNEVLRYKLDANNFQVIELGGDNQIDAATAGMTNFRFDAWFSEEVTASSSFLMKIVDFGATTTEAVITINDASIPAMAQGQWITFDFTLTELAGLGLGGTSNIQQVVIDVGSTTEVYLDNIYFYEDVSGGGGGGPVAPTVAADAPTDNAADVASIYSDSYTDVPNLGYNLYGGAAYEAVDLSGNEVLRYKLDANNFQVIELGGDNQIDAATAGMTNFRFDAWFSEEVTASSSFLMKIVDFGATTTEAVITINDASIPAMAQGQWITFDFTLTELAGLGLGGTSNIQQVVIDVGSTTEVYLDNIYFYEDMSGGGGGGVSTLELPVTFESETIDYELTDFGGNASMIVADPEDAGNKVVQSTKGTAMTASEVWGGTTVGETSGFGAIPFTAENTTMSVKVWSPAAGIPIRLKVEDRTNNAITVETEVMTTVANSWETLVFDFSSQADGTAALNIANTYDKGSLFFNFGTSESGQVYYWDDLEFGGEPGGGGGTGSGIELPVTFESETIDYELTDFGGNASMIIADPEDASNKVVQSVKGTAESASEVWAGTTVGETSGVGAIPFTSENTTMTVRVWSPTAGIPVRLKVENKNDNTVTVETEATTTTANAWETLSFDFSNQAEGTAALNIANTYDKASIFFNFNTAGNGEVYYWDDLVFDGESGGGGGTGSDIELPVTFESETIDYELTDFGGNASMIIADPEDAANKVVQSVKGTAESASEVWAGTTVGETSGFGAIPFTAESTTMTVRVWSPTAGIPVRLKVENKNDNTVTVETEATTTTANAWETLSFDFSNQAEGTAALNIANTYDKASIFFNFNTAGNGEVYYWDDLVFDGESGGGGGTGSDIELPVTFESETIDYELTDFGGNASMIIVDPEDAANKVVQSVKGTAESASEVWAGTTVGETSGFGAIPFTAESTTMTVRVWSPTAGIPVRLKVEDKSNNEISVEAETTTSTAEAWEILSFDFSNQVSGTSALDVNNTYDKASIFFDFNTAGSGQSYYWDDVAFSGETGGGVGADATLSALLVNGESVNRFNSETFEYYVEFPEGVIEIPTVTATKTEAAAMVTVTDPDGIPGIATIVVVSEDETATNTYTIEYAIDENLSKDATLSDLLVNGTSVEGFDADIFEYTVELAETVTEVPDVAASVNDVNAMVTYDNAVSLPGKTKVNVTAEDGVTERTYSIDFTYPEGTAVTYTVTGTITANGSPFESGSVVIYDIDNINNTSSASINSDGTYTISSLSEGVYYLYVASSSDDYVTTFYGNVSTVIDVNAIPSNIVLDRNRIVDVVMIAKPDPAVEMTEGGATINFQAQSVNDGSSRIVSGRVSQGDALANVLVILSTSDDQYVADGVTDNDGLITFSGLPTGNYKLTVEVPGVGRVSSEVSAVEGESAEFTGLIDGDNISINQVLGLEDELLDNMTVYPNPAVSKLNLSIPNGLILKDYRLSVISLSGRIVNVGSKLNEAELVLDVSSLETGVYFIRLVTKDGSAERKFIKQ